MNRFQAELQRLLLPPASPPAGAESLRLAPTEGEARALLLEVDGPGAWEALAPAWQGVQADLQLPAPAIAVGGRGYQLWFSLAAEQPAASGRAFLAGLRLRYLPQVPPERVRAEPLAPVAASASATGCVLPPASVAEGRWSAFVAPDLAALFAEEPWLDLAPSQDAQAELLARLQPIKPAEFERALEQLRPAPGGGAVRQSAAHPETAPAAGQLDPRRFLLEVMNDRAVELHLRIEAAKALLPWCQGEPGR
jgi:hypothetical protein